MHSVRPSQSQFCALKNEWKSGKREVRLISAASKDRKSYIYSRGAKTAKIDYEISGAILANVLRATFAD